MHPQESLIADIIRIEGGYVDHPNDRGGPTKFGITQRVARNYGYTGDMLYLPEDLARWILAQRYWFEPQFDLVYKLSPRIAHELLDTGINQGPETASKYFQRVLNAFNRQAKDYPDLAVDGDIGPITLEALSQLLAVRGPAAEQVVLAALNCLQGASYLGIAAADFTQEDFVYGWINQRVKLP